MDRKQQEVPAVVYLSVNDGSDTRINKEVDSLSRVAQVHFVGVQQEAGDRDFVKERAASVQFVRGRRRSPVTAVRLLQLARMVAGRVHPRSVHVVNEDLALLMTPLLWRQRNVVVDVFDSLFLRRSFPKPVASLLRRWVYGLASCVLVTDAERAGLMPERVRRKLRILENFPYAVREPVEGVRSEGPLRIFAGGTLNRARGLTFLRGLLDEGDAVEAVMAGWLYDEEARDLSRHPKVRFHGTVGQREAMKLAADADFILCLYEPSNRNNIHASPNKVYDAIQAGTPVIINREARVSRFVEEQGLGLVLDRYGSNDYAGVLRRLREVRRRFQAPEELRRRCTWEAIEHRLLEAHGLTGWERAGFGRSE